MTAAIPPAEPLVRHLSRWLGRIERTSLIVAGGATLACIGVLARAGTSPVMIAVAALGVLLVTACALPPLVGRGPEADLIAMSALHGDHQLAEFRAAGGGSTIPRRMREIDDWLEHTSDTQQLRTIRTLLLLRRGRLQAAASALGAIEPATAGDVFEKALLDAIVQNKLGTAGDLGPAESALHDIDDPGRRTCATFAIQAERTRRAAAAGDPIDEPVRAAVAAHHSLWPSRSSWFRHRLRLLGPKIAFAWVLACAGAAAILSLR